MSTHDLTTPTGLASYLAPTKFAASDIQTLSGGTIGFVYRVLLKAPKQSGVTSVVVKHGLGYAATNAKWAMNVERMTFEHEALNAIASSGLFTFESTVQAPRVLHFDPETHTRIMTDLTPARTLSAVLIEALESGTIKDVSTRIGTALGDFMGRFHRWGSEPAQARLRARFLENVASRETMLQLRYQLMYMTAEQYGMKRDWMDEMVKDGMADAEKGGSVIAMADFWFDNVLVSLEPELRIYIIDWETARCTRPELDIAHFAVSVYSLACLHPSSDFTLMQSFMQSYNAHFALDDVQIALSGGRDVLSFSLMESWIQHQENRVKEEIVRHGLELLEAARAGDLEEIRKNVVVRDMFGHAVLS
ncbi:hypothetical protein FRC09_016208 [Ceratobasidium sp. 395]|nr:hypothetical protein FRC09_016208 [Ceratobasidium sp. 395]